MFGSSTIRKWQAEAAGGKSDAESAIIEALAAGATRQETAQRIGVAERTVYRRLQDADFRSRVEQRRRELQAHPDTALAPASATIADPTPPAVEAATLAHVYDRTLPGGRYIHGGRYVNAHGEPLE